MVFESTQEVVQMPNSWVEGQETFPTCYQKQAFGMNGLSECSKFFLEFPDLISGNRNFQIQSIQTQAVS
ncbi:hypothetical protein C8N25_102300 [Algoriphagus antarcticus]|uniref:Uncharacterized protein n=1 Tax=Algoriphagus antarcticus TaxID=238540 RepID=A0A3E0E7C5_9BACT|nr:hypothetical protein C8N25_102300 [Algoriphagus antarcticus]